MAQSPPTQQEFHYNKVELFKAETLGMGSYGVVCKARCDELPCAAKILHPVMFQFNDPGTMGFMRKFEQECHFFRTTSHPNIVQYIATSRDRETGQPVLLMELMDESLTSFLERSQQPLPYHTQVNLCHDIALALAYLHSNGMVHRDLSSNNVLLIAGSRAKVTDFGMSKLIDTNPRMTPLTKCPGTLVYMSPEALGDPPVYTEKLDCFSEGVLTIQIITRQFPNPSPAMRTISDPRFQLGRVHEPVPEKERRRSHIYLVDPAHPLLTLALRCLEYNEKDRPSAQALCRYLATLKKATKYTESLQQAQERGTQPINTERGERQMQQVQILQKEVKEKDRQLQAKDTTILGKEREICQLQRELQHTTHQLQEKDRVIEARERQLRELDHQLQTNEQVTAEFQQNLLQREREVRDLEKRLSVKERLVQQQPYQQQSYQQLKISNVLSTKQEASERARRNTQLEWESSKIQHTITYTQPAVDGKIAYFRAGRNVVEYDSNTGEWSILLQECPHKNFALAVINGRLTAIGGMIWGSSTNKLLSLTWEGWVEHFPPMPTRRFHATALCTGRHLIVAGGEKDTNARTNKVEVMNTRTQQWIAASGLPHPIHVYQATATLYGDDIFLLGGRGQNDKPSRSVFKCSLDALLQSRAFSQLWQQVADLPVTYTACATLQGRLLAVGGLDSFEKKTTAVYEYNPAINTWEVVSHTPTPCHGCAVAVLPGNRLMAVDSEKVYIGNLQ